jgi:hypothetical protein
MTTKAIPFPILGTVSHGTLRAEHLIPRFMEALDTIKEWRSLGEHGQTAEEFGRLDDLCASIEQAEKRDADYFSTERAIDDLVALETELCAMAPEGYYFGAHEGDGSDFGFWPTGD